MIRHSHRRKGFTLIELMVSIFIFVLMTALLVVKYGNFNQSVLFTNLAYDIALTLRTAQTYGLGVQGQAGGTEFQYPYGVAFCSLASCPVAGGTNMSNRQIILFADVNSGDNSPPPDPPPDAQGAYDTNDILVSSYAIKRGAKILGFCVIESGSGCNPTDGTTTRVDFTFKRPDPNAIICTSTFPSGAGRACAQSSGATTQPGSYVKILIQAVDGSTRAIIVRRTGQISVEDVGS